MLLCVAFSNEQYKSQIKNSCDFLIKLKDAELHMTPGNICAVNKEIKERLFIFGGILVGIQLFNIFAAE